MKDFDGQKEGEQGSHPGKAAGWLLPLLFPVGTAGVSSVRLPDSGSSGGQADWFKVLTLGESRL